MHLLVSAFENICERYIYIDISRSQELSESQLGSVMERQLCKKSSHVISVLLNISQSAVSGIRRKRKHLGIKVTQPQRGIGHIN